MTMVHLEWEGKAYTYDSEGIEIRHAIVIKNHTGLNLQPWEMALNEGDPQAWQGMMWLMKQQNGEITQIATENFPVVKYMNVFREAAARAEEEEARQKKSEAGKDGRPKDVGAELTATG